MWKYAADTKICRIDPLFPRITENIHDIPQDSCLLGQVLNSETPEYKAGVSITREESEVSAMSYVLPTFRRTRTLEDVTLYQPYKSCSNGLSVLRECSESRTEINQ